LIEKDIDGGTNTKLHTDEWAVNVGEVFEDEVK
jgi:hypothetical protein